MDVGETGYGSFIQVQWTGFLDKKDWTWNELNELWEDIPEKVEELLRYKGEKSQKGVNRIRTKVMSALRAHYEEVSTIRDYRNSRDLQHAY